MVRCLASLRAGQGPKNSLLCGKAEVLHKDAVTVSALPLRASENNMSVGQRFSKLFLFLRSGLAIQ